MDRYIGTHTHKYMDTHIQIHIYIYSEESAHVILEAGKSRDLPSASWRRREARG